MRLYFGHYLGTSDTMTSYKTVAKVKGQGVGKGDRVTFPNVMLTMPPLPPSDLVGCSIIDGRYHLTVSYGKPHVS